VSVPRCLVLTGKTFITCMRKYQPMDRIIKFLILGFFFFLVISLLDQIVHFDFSLFGSVAVAVVIAVGILRSPKIGLSFGLSSFPAYTIAWFLWGGFRWLVLFRLFLLFANSGIFALYGYLPSKYYLRSKRLSRLAIAFLGVLSLEFILSFCGSLVFWYSIDPGNFGEAVTYSLGWHLRSAAITLVIGGISTGLSTRHLKTSAMQLRQPQAFSSSETRAYSSSIRCPNCGYENPQDLQFCGKCGAPLSREDETRIY